MDAASRRRRDTGTRQSTFPSMCFCTNR
jgi:hypothetical protein